MRTNLFTLSLLVLSLSVSSQDYQLFNAGSKKVFTTFPEAGVTFSLSFDSAVQFGVDSVYYPYRSVEDEFIDADSCMFWGGPICRPQTKPIWIGTEVVKKPADSYQFTTNAGLSLIFNFGLLPGEDSQFFEDDVQRFKISAENPDTMNVCGQVDSVKFFRITHTDIQGNIIESELNNQLIILGKDFGLIRFFLVDSFPQVLQPITLLGNSSPEAGLLRITNELIYDHQPGDEIQFHDIFYRQYGPPFENYDRFIKYTFLSRTDNSDTISYTIARFTFYQDSLNGVLDTIQMTYLKNEVLATVPFEKPDTLWFLMNRNLYLDDYFGLPLWSYRESPEHLVFCGADNCWGPYDTNGPPLEGEIIYVIGLGEYLNQGYQFGAPPNGYSYSKRIVYFKKNGTDYGNEVIVSIKPSPLPEAGFSVYPSPVGNMLYVKT
ncbi:MAG: hypothetical protein HGA37_16175, partial [Lentimicrobium sp.]|nr:hypothetical protein [Lentimicrobium sp.]